MKSIDGSFPENDDETCSRLAGGDKNPSVYVMDALGKLKETEYERITAHFRDSVVPLIKENERETVVNAISLLIQEDNSINSNTVINPITQQKKNSIDLVNTDIASFLAGTLIYVLRNTKNRHKKGRAKAIGEEYIKRAKAKNAQKKSISQWQLPVYDERPVQRFVSGKHFTASSIGIVFSSWNETNRYDKKLIETLTGKEYSDVYEDIRSQNEVAISIEDGIIKCNNSDELRDSLITDIDESFIILLLDSFSLLLKASTEFSGLSNECVFGICDFLARFGCHIKIANRISRSEWKARFYSFIDSVVNNRVALCSISIGLELLVEADMDSFLSTIELAIQNEESVLKSVIIDEKNSSIIYHLAYAIKKAAGSEKSFTFAMRLLFDMSEYNDVFFENMGYVLFLRCPQTAASINSRLGVIRYFFNKNRELAWKYLVSILPGNCSHSIIPTKFRYYPLSFTAITADVKKEADAYVDLACHELSGKADESLELIRIFPIISSESACCVADAIIDKTEMRNISRELYTAIEKAYSYYDKYDEDKRSAISSLHNHFQCSNSSERFRVIFDYKDKKLSDDKTVKEAREYIRSIFENEGYKGLIDETAEIEDIHYYFEVVCSALADEETKALIDYLLKTNQAWYLYLLVNSMRPDRLINLMSNDQNIINVISKYECDRPMMKYINTLSVEEQNELWSRLESADVGAFDKREFSKMIKQLLANKNYSLAIRLLGYRMGCDDIDNDLIIMALNSCDIPEDTHSPLFEEMRYPIYSIITYLQNQEDVSSETMVRVEAKYINFLQTEDRVIAPNVFNRMANDPQYVEQILLDRKRRLETGIYDSSANTLFMCFRVTPGTQRDTSFNFTSYSQWYEYAVNKADPIIKEDMMELFGRASLHVGSDEDGFLINRKVAGFLEKCDRREVMTMFEIELFDSIGSITITDDLREPKRIVNELTEKAELCEGEGYLRIADAFRSVSRSLETHFELL